MRESMSTLIHSADLLSTSYVAKLIIAGYTTLNKTQLVPVSMELIVYGRE